MGYPTDFNDTVVYNGVDLYLPKDCSMTVFEDSRLFLFGEVYLNGLPVMTGSGVTSGAETAVGPTEPVDPGIVLWFDTSSGYGELKVKTGGSWKTVEDPADNALHDEIYIGGVAPVGDNYELWVDTATDPPAPGESYISVGNALGIVAVGTLVGNLNIAANILTQVTSNVPVTLLNGRRYKVAIGLRAINADTMSEVKLRDGTTVLPGNAAYMAPPPSAGKYSSYEFSWLLNGDDLTKNLNIALLVPIGWPNIIISGDSNGYFYVEDVGPSSRPALPMTVPYPDGYVSPGNALGVVATGSFVASASLAAATPVPITNPLSVKTEIGRRYKVVCIPRSFAANVATATSIVAELRDANVNIVDAGQQMAGQFNFVAPNGASMGSLGYFEFIINGNGLVRSLTVVVTPTAALTITTNAASFFYVEDIGPNTSPALPLPATPPAWTPATLMGYMGAV